MFVRTKVIALSLTALGTIGTAGVGLAGPAAAATTYTCGSVTSASWGSGQYCKGNDGTWKVRIRDEATDGYCVEGKFFNEDTNSWQQTYPRSQECNGVWKTVIVSTEYLGDGVRAYRGDGRYVTLDRP
jgi:hypothetical protein